MPDGVNPRPVHQPPGAADAPPPGDAQQTGQAPPGRYGEQPSGGAPGQPQWVVPAPPGQAGQYGWQGQGGYYQQPPPPPGPYRQQERGNAYGQQGWAYPPVYPPPGAVPLPPPGAFEEESRSERIRKKLGLKGWSVLILIPFFLLLLLFVVVVFVGRPFVVHGSSMETTLHDGDRVFVVKYRGNTTPNRGDVVVIKDVPGSQEMLIKRVVGIAGDRLDIGGGSIVVNGKYTFKSTNNTPLTVYTRLVPDESIFVMGDNEARSYDSRVFGPVPMNKVVGKAVLIFWPPSDVKFLSKPPAAYNTMP